MKRLLIALTALVSPAFAQAQEQSIFPTLILFGGMFVVMYFLMIRPQQKRAKAHRELINSLKVGDEILLSSGFVARIRALDENYVSAEIAPNVVIKAQRQAINSLLPKGTYREKIDATTEKVEKVEKTEKSEKAE
ncbi:preprotein translocase subunit YajC [Ignatzschineria cameli]|uniref:Sec translocon accessory complex subunit YajC n=1 Tax=Ignatzschineria cameli TaxID=2182793 RepID=A0A2U2AKG8_9GAMM|nr:preprotein translocase subunit YajC [Ignatzschineria cameli]PWD83345.1 preprotein translocase subunit YajC [Ignatzschineria cameli]PWD85701.1 preprotein translocase subunit YajC [Ignatzschineria cameli]PWD88371.1 preprotein translocase subunit YajC [Ignatzschineria cameli]PWD88830.1 preprotein translocase subunit YajC [Ignatzschineria cameli]PWD89337.1 preprotein translocase subunit YajC [Ignatzschineria cameli]